MHVEVNDNSNVTDRLLEIEKILLEVQRRIPDIEGVAIVTRDGLPIASLLHSDNNEDQISAMTAASLSLSERVVIELKRGIMEQVIISGSDGLIAIQNAGEYAVLVAIVDIKAKLGLVLLDMKRAAEKLSELI